MEQLMRVEDSVSVMMAGEVQHRLIQVSKKIKLCLSRQQVISLDFLLQQYLFSSKAVTLEEKAIYCLIFDIWDRKVRKILLTLRQKIRITLSVEQSWAMVCFLNALNLENHPYEDSMRWYIVRTIDQQIA